jgi:hypothetical protein
VALLGLTVLAPIVQAGLVLHMIPEGTKQDPLHDASGQGHGGVPEGRPATTPGSDLLHFDGNDDAVRVARSRTLCLQEFTLAFWLVPSGHENTDPESVIRGPSGNGYNRGWRLFLRAAPAARVLCFSANFGSERPETWKLGSLPLHAPSHIAVVLAGKHVRLYLNGKLVRTADRPGPVAYAADDSPLQLGFAHYQKLRGDLGDVRLYDEPLAASEIQALAERRPRLAKPAPKPVPDQTWFRPDRLHVPDYTLCRNLVQNPSFEAGGHSWEALARFRGTSRQRLYTIDTEHAHTGLRSLKLYGFAGQKSAADLKTFAVPVIPGAAYTLSFYCRGATGRSLTARLYTGTWPGKLPGGGYQPFLLTQRVPLTESWQRHSFTVTAPNNAMSPVFFTEDRPSEDYEAWIDDVQLEAGGQATPFASKPFAAELLTSSFDSTVQPGETLNARLAIHAAASGPATLKLAVLDVYGHELYADERKIELKTNERVETALPFDDQPWFRSGLYVLRVDVTASGGFRDTDWFRFGRMANLEGKHHQRVLFSYYGMFGSVPNTEIAAREEMHMGLGSSVPFASVPPPEWVEICRRNKILIASSIFRKGAESLPGDGREFQSTPCRKVNVKGNWKDGAWPDPEAAVDVVEENAYGVAKANPGIRHWKLTNEPSHSLQDDPRKLKLFVDLMRAAAKGIRRAQPDARIMTPDPTNMYPGNGIREIERFIDAGMLEFCDIVAIHPYRPRPEEPDFDADLRVFLDMLNKHGFKGEIWFTEGIYFTPYRLPRFGLEPTKFSDFWRCGPFSYAVGTGERMAAAYQMRMWLTALKYSDRVRQMTGGVKDRLLDLNRTPRAVVWAPNTLGHLLGDARFVCDIDAGEGARAYLFIDGKSRPVAAIWNTDPEVDDEQADPQICSIPFGEEPFQVFDAFGAPTELRDFANQPIRPLPTFIRGEPEHLRSFRAALEKLTRTEGAPTPVSAHVSVRNARTLDVTLASKRSRELSLSVSIDIGAMHQQRAMDFAPHQKHTLSFPIQGEPGQGAVLPIRLVAKLANGTEATILEDTITVFAIARRTSPILIDGDLGDWGESLVPMPNHLVEFPPTRKACGNRLPEFLAHPPVWQGKQDLSARFAMRWDEKTLYLAVAVTDDVVDLPPRLERAYNHDSLQFYLDTFGDARSRKVNGYDNNDWSFDIATVDGQTAVTRGQVPEWQLCFLQRGPAPGVKAACKTTVGGYVYELAFPRDEVRPLQLSAGTVFGCALMINENDKDYRKRALTLTPAGTEPHRRPHLYPIAVLSE